MLKARKVKIIYSEEYLKCYFEPDILFVVLGVGTYKMDPLAGFKFEKETYAKIAKRLKVFKKKLILFVGGYSHEVPELWWEIVSNLV